MVNVSLISLNSSASQLMLEQIARIYHLYEDETAFEQVDTDPEIVRRLLGWISITETVIGDFEIEHAKPRIEIIRKKVASGATRHDIATEIRVLREMISSGMNGQLIFRYPNAKKEVLERWQDDWGPVLKMFPSTHRDILAGVDLWALGHATASVFHMMRVLEHGLRALAKDVGLTFEAQNWQNIIEQIEDEVRKIGKTLPTGAEKSERLRFLSNAAKEFMYFKDGWRNHVSHNRASYTEDEAEAVFRHVRELMKVLSTRLSEISAA